MEVRSMESDARGEIARIRISEMIEVGEKRENNCENGMRLTKIR